MGGASGHLAPVDLGQIAPERSKPLAVVAQFLLSLARPVAHRPRILMVRVAVWAQAACWQGWHSCPWAQELEAEVSKGLGATL